MPVETKGDGFPITLKAPSQRFSKRFNSEEEVRRWLQSEIAWWEERGAQTLNPYFPDARHQLQFLPLLTTNILQEAMRETPGRSALEFVESRGVVISQGRQGILLSKIYDEQPQLYPGALMCLSASVLNLKVGNLAAHLINLHIPSSVLMSGLGAVLTAVAEDRTSTAERKMFDELVARTQMAAEESESQRIQIDELYEFSKNRFDLEHDAQIQVGEKTADHFRAMLQSELDFSKARVAELEEQVRDRLVLEAPTKYWTEKAKSHRTTAIWFGVIFVLALAGGVYWLTHWGVGLVSEAYQTIVGERENPGLLALVPLAFITLPTLAFAWLLRHVSRIIVQNLSLQADAQLRGTIATTYSALVHEQSGTTPELAIALNALFRPVDGSGHAEIAPPNVKDIIEMGKSG
ncbi:DUF6161 domain-containing protein [Shinella sp. H4-D48]|uniref:DUF6161 domain-containing protein n=1 Tax=Shinella sp. H4-D48 TaxID=2925841 RepID=UPI001F52E137|nr:DUF6161 domain-containing protein [Shinella sp. H4-D48]UNK36602.1 DUF6161 domain-containing protein [Shinella sp. H4-D48]